MLYDFGVHFIHLTSDSKAIVSFKKALNVLPNATLEFDLAEAFYKKGNYKKALQNCKASKNDMLSLKDDDFGNIRCSGEFIEDLEKDVLLGPEKN